ncbi:MAG: pseudouridine synthase [Lachnospiraceae bacterium]|nr:pseudouridine synthase [Lachnospiraceae bacterium]
MENKEIRLNKYLSDAGVCSRREGDRLIERGKVTVDGTVALMGQKVLPGQRVCVNGKPVSKEEQRVLFLFHKPKGIVCTSEKREKHNIIDYLQYPVRVTYVGRLDKDSEGLMLMTNDGELNNKMMRARNMHEKEYEVRVNKPVTADFLRQMAEGVPILDTVTRPCKVRQIGKDRFDIILTQGLNRQIRRMCEYLGYEILQLKRIRIMNLELGGLPVGKTRELTGQEMETLYKMVEQELE